MSLRPGLGATYRVQLGPDLSFRDAAGLVPYLSRLGVQTLYCSPVAEAVPGSTHGYDGTEPTRLRAELGGKDGYGAIVTACEQHDLGILVDIVPNHLATWPGGPWWRRLLVEGPASDLAPVFDVTWKVAGGKVVLPLLGAPLADALAGGTVRLGTRRGEAVLLVGGVDLPIAGGHPRPDEAVADVLAAQHYRLTDWHDARDRNYRRFFDIDGLVGVRVETADVFALTHALVRDLACTGRLSAVRVDHVDGLRDPATYLRRLAALTGVPIVVEKILSSTEPLPPDWGVHGTTGYEAIDDEGGVLVEPDGLGELVRQAQAEGEPGVDAATVTARRFITHARFPGELERLAHRLEVPTEDLAATVSHLTRYRTYLDDGPPRPDDVAEWRQAARSAAAPGVAAAVLDPVRRHTVLGLQQLTGAVMAKGVEDTAWYRLAGPLAFCEVGGTPGRDRHDGVARLHARAAERAADGRAGLLPGTTHDTKRAQDVRSRLLALSEHPEPFAEGLRSFRRALGLPADGGDLSFETRALAQVLLGVLPASPGDDDRIEHLIERLAAILRKSAREAKVRSSWSGPDEAYEARLVDLGTRALLGEGALVRECFGALVAEVARLGALNSLSAVVLRAALPGVPDCYQGDEVWNLSLVDPDNRRPVDFRALADALDGLEDGTDPIALRRAWRDGRVKLLVTAQALRARRRAGDVLDPTASYVPLAPVGAAARNILAFARRSQRGQWLVAVVARLGASLVAAPDDLPVGSAFAGTTIPLPAAASGPFRDLLTERSVPEEAGGLACEAALAALPVALLLAPPPREAARHAAPARRPPRRPAQQDP